jgi:lipopolysaccharide/colanic/teichoic acid biosynthesis glycosyltransferase
VSVRAVDPTPAPPPGLPRAADVAIATLALLATAPVSLVVAAAIWLDDRRPLIYRQPRIGRRGRRFELLKFRTMYAGSDPVGLGMEVSPGDPRVTRIGGLLRRLSVDELPNLINVLRGEMSIVGPRPTLPTHVPLYTERQRRRLAVKPGVTGWAQVNGRIGIPWEARIELDVWYVDHRSPRLDLRILARTVRLVLTGRGLTTD